MAAFSHDGKELWQRSLSRDYGRFQNEFGLGSSPLQTDDAVIVLVDDTGPSYLVAINKRDGRTLWKRDRTPRKSWSSPALLALDGVPQVVVSSDGTVDGYDISSGELLWTYTEVGGNTGTTPIGISERRFLISASPGRQGEHATEAKRSNGVLHVKKSNQGWSVEPGWITQEVTPSWASPIVHRGCAYWINSVGVVFCFDVESGKLHYRERTKQSCWATPLGVGERVYFFGKDGLTTVLASGPDFRVLAENWLWDPQQADVDTAAVASETDPQRRKAAALFAGPVLYGFAAADGSFIIRTGSRIYSVRE